MMVVGITAGIGSGKSTVLKMFQGLGAKTIIADKIVRMLYRKKFMKQRLGTAFGNVFTPWNSLDRKALAKIVFSGKKELKKLEKIVHPFVYREIKKRLSKLKKSRQAKLVVVEVPLLFESTKKFLSLLDFVVVVKATKSQQLERLEKRGLNRKNALQRMASQLPTTQKLRKADFVIDNTKSLSFAKKQVKKIFGLLAGKGSKQ